MLRHSLFCDGYLCSKKQFLEINMKTKLLIILLLGTFILAKAQNQPQPTSFNPPGIITGKVIDKTSKQPLSYVNIIVKENQKIISGGITDDKGSFLLKNLELKKYQLEVQFMGFKTVTVAVNLTAENSTENLKTIAIEENAIELAGVEIVKEKSTIVQKIDRKVINVGKDLISAGATAGEIMNNIPSVSVDQQTNEISLRGNSNVRVLIDGKPTNIPASQLLKQIPSASIKQIELITNPSAKYNPEGMSGIINIILNKNAQMGFNGSVNTSVTFGKTPKPNTSFDMNYKTGKFNFFGNYGFNHGNNKSDGLIENFETNRFNTQKFDRNDFNTSHLAKLGLDFYINDQNTVSFYTNQNLFRGYKTSLTQIDFFDNTTYIDLITNKPTTNTDFVQGYESNGDNYTQTYNLDYKRKFKKEGHNLEFETNYNKNNSPNKAVFTDINPANNQFIAANKNDIEQLGENTISNLDYVNPLTKTIKLELGLENRYENQTQSLAINNNYSSAFDYKRIINSTYITLGKQWKKWNYQAGLRVEQYKAEALFKQLGKDDERIKNDLLNYYPSSFLTYNATDSNAFNLSFSRRVDRPGVDQINPIRQWTTPTLESRGNPNLVPQFTNSFELNYTRKTSIGSFTSGIFYRRIENEITRVVFVNPENNFQKILSFDNFTSNDAYGAEISGNLDFRKWWSANVSLDAYKKKVKGTIEDTPGNYQFVEADVTNFNARINNSFKINKKLVLQLFGMYRSKDLSLQFERGAMWKMDLGGSYTVLKGNGSVTARFSDIFDSMHFSFNGERPFRAKGQFYWENQTFFLGFNYRFGSGKNKALQRKSRNANESQGGGGMM